MVLTKEYRIPLPFTLEEFRVGHIYMIAKTAKQATDGNDGVELISSTEFESKKLGKGVYRRRVFHLGRTWKLPDWSSRIISENVLRVEEETWDCYPYIKTVYTCPLFGTERCKITALTIYKENDRGESDNVHNIKKTSTNGNIDVDVLDISQERLDSKHYKTEEDPSLFTSKLTNRAPLPHNWMEKTTPIMCAYKLVTVQFDYWGLRSRVEPYVHQIFRNVYLQSHQQVFCWMDEWINKSLTDICLLEEEMSREANNKLHEQKVALARLKKGRNNKNRNQRGRKKKKGGYSLGLTKARL